MPDLNESDLKTDFVELPTYASLKAVEIPIIKLSLSTMDVSPMLRKGEGWGLYPQTT